MDNFIYSSNNEDSLLKAVGPHRLIIADDSISGIQRSSVLTIGQVFTFGDSPNDEKMEIEKEEKPIEHGC